MSVGVATNREAPRPGPTPPAVVDATPPRPDIGVARATAATLALARDSAAPVGRLGRMMLASAGRMTRVDLAGREMPAAGVWQGVRDRVGSAPLSGTARHAFGFLLAPAPGGPGRAPRPEKAPKGGA